MVKVRQESCRSSQWISVVVLLILFMGLLGYLVISRVREYFSQMDPMLQKIRLALEPLLETLRKDHERVRNIQFYEGNKSYTINKKKIHLCLRDAKGQYYDMNMLIYVAIHELAHVICDEIGHTEKFHLIFQDLLQKATEMGIYDPTKPIIRNYCGHH